jgi:hypothetical protein
MYDGPVVRPLRLPSIRLCLKNEIDIPMYSAVIASLTIGLAGTAVDVFIDPPGGCWFWCVQEEV